MHVRLNGDTKGVNVSMKGCLSVYVGPVTDWQRVQDVPSLSPYDSLLITAIQQVFFLKSTKHFTLFQWTITTFIMSHLCDKKGIHTKGLLEQ